MQAKSNSKKKSTGFPKLIFYRRFLYGPPCIVPLKFASWFRSR